MNTSERAQRTPKGKVDDIPTAYIPMYGIFYCWIYIVSAGICHDIAKTKLPSASFWIIRRSLIGALAIRLAVIVKYERSSSD
ncbi:MAG: hypothetical protein ACJAY2_003280 [Pseudomonadales bacterium]|jgi:hypothetical protein